MADSAIYLPGNVDDSVYGNFHPYEGTYDSTVYLWDARYSESGVPANGSTVTNLVRDRAAELSGLTAANCDFEVTNNSGSFLAVERTALGGIHVASTQAGSQNAAASFTLAMDADFANWLLSQTDAGADYAVMVSLWFEITRPLISNAASQATTSIANNVSSTSNYLLQTTGGLCFGSGTILPTDGQDFSLAQAAGTRGVLAPASNQWTGSKPANLSTSLGQRMLANVGAQAAWATFNYNKCFSGVIYRVQMDLVDLSDIDGATTPLKAAAILAEQNAMLARDFAVGGQLYGDTYTAAATLKP